MAHLLLIGIYLVCRVVVWGVFRVVTGPSSLSLRRDSLRSVALLRTKTGGGGSRTRVP